MDNSLILLINHFQRNLGNIEEHFRKRSLLFLTLFLVLLISTSNKLRLFNIKNVNIPFKKKLI